MSSKMISSKKLPPKPALVLSREASSFVRKRRLTSQQTIDTNTHSREEQDECNLRVIEEEITLEISRVLKTIEDYHTKIIFKKQSDSDRERLKKNEEKIQRYDRQILELEEEIKRLKDVYHRPKKTTPAYQYTKLHIKAFTLTDQIVKQRQHLELHASHHRNLKNKAEKLHKSIKELLPSYLEIIKQKGFKPLSYGEFRRKAIEQKKEIERKQRLRIVSQKSISRRSSNSIRSQSGKEVPVSKKNLWYMQRRKSIADQARQVGRKKHGKQVGQLQDQRRFLRDENEKLNQKIDQLQKQIITIESELLYPSNLVNSRKHSRSEAL